MSDRTVTEAEIAKALEWAREWINGDDHGRLLSRVLLHLAEERRVLRTVTDAIDEHGAYDFSACGGSHEFTQQFWDAYRALAAYDKERGR